MRRFRPTWNWRFAGPRDIDLRIPGSARSEIARSRPDRIINAAAYTAVDQAEREPELAFAINSQGAGEIAERRPRWGRAWCRSPPTMSSKAALTGRSPRTARPDH